MNLRILLAAGYDTFWGKDVPLGGAQMAQQRRLQPRQRHINRQVIQGDAFEVRAVVQDPDSQESNGENRFLLELGDLALLKTGRCSDLA